MLVTRPAHTESHPMDSSRMLRELLELARVGRTRSREGVDVSSIVSLGLLRRLLSAIRYRDPATMYHSRRTGLICVGIGQRLGWEDRQLRVIEVAALLHDLGKIGVPDHILLKPGKLTPDEAEWIATLNRVVLAIMQACHIDAEVLEIISDAHQLEDKEHLSSTLGSRILAVADAFDSLTNKQPFRTAMKQEDALRILEERAGKQFDRNVVAALKRWLESEDAAVLRDEVSAQQSIQASAPVDEATRADASLFCHLCNYLCMLESMYDGYYIINGELEFCVWSGGAARLFGRQSRVILGQIWSQPLLYVASGDSTSDHVKTAFHSGQPTCNHLNLRDSNGENRETQVQTFPLRDPEGTVQGVLELLCDSTQSKSKSGQFRELQMAATRDALTGVYNRGKLEKEIAELFDEHQATGAPLSFIYLDLDHFKAINDRLSHAVGDKVLVDVARFLEDEVYSGEVVGRYGGEEFVIVCPETTLEQALEKAERLRTRLMAAPIGGRTDLRVTASLGVSEIEKGDTADSARKRADEALYDSKRNGRNRTSSRRRTAVATPAPVKVKAPVQRECIYKTEFSTCMASELITLKLKGFVEDTSSKIVSVTSDQLVVQCGSTSFFGGWGTAAERQPIKASIQIQHGQGTKGAGSARQHCMSVTMEPLGKPQNYDVFEARAKHVLEQLRSYCVGE